MHEWVKVQLKESPNANAEEKHGHTSVETAQIYTHVMKNPLES
jgi:hypothetical protein